MTRIRTRIDRVGSLLKKNKSKKKDRLIASQNVTPAPGGNHETAIGWRSKIHLKIHVFEYYIPT